ncbi:MAG: tRNA preQ1(34) S-adenosylmethionine ribosyltransferase-isomerase QueA [Candidatus Omnitrophota bacterium]|nr:MAG: tRNA preQ1(34) S-adenosylmethionine ribosyltransferase-isomerase QueA [Candidatus Omnitrophota bacterium]
MKEEYNLSNFGYTFPPHLVAQRPLKKRDQARVLIVDRKLGTFRESVFKDIINFLKEGEVLVLNNTKVIRAKIFGKKPTGARLEFLLLKEIDNKGKWEALIKRSKRLKLEEEVIFEGGFKAKLVEKTSQGKAILEFSPPSIRTLIEKYGEMPLPPYIKEELKEANYYQTVFAKKEGAVAAPTAGLHFTPSLLKEIQRKGVKVVYLTLHCGLATFRPVKTQDIREHPMEEEYFCIPKETASVINEAKLHNRRVIAVGTTVVRALESCAQEKEKKPAIIPGEGKTSLYIFPGYKFKIVDALITNFHTPYSTNLILISAFCGLELTKKAYLYAVKREFRFFSFGDAMFVK